MNIHTIKSMLAACFFTVAFSQQPAMAQKKYINPANMDLAYKPGDNFYMYAGGTWIKNNPVPAKETRWGTFQVLRDFNINAVKSVLEKAAANKSAAAGSAERRVADFYKAGMDSAGIEKRGYDPIKKDLARIASLETTDEILSEVSAMRVNGIAVPMYGFFVGQDKKDVENMIPQLTQGGTTLPDRDYYLKADPRSTQIQQAYKKYVQILFSLTGSAAEAAAKNANTIFELEKKMAAVQLSRVEMRDAYKTYNKFQLEEFSKTTPGMNWRSILSGLKVTREDTVIVNNPAFFVELNHLLKTVSVNDWKIYLQWNLLKSAAPYLASDFVDATFEYNKVMTGQKVQTPRWQTISQQTDGGIPDLLGQLYVKEYFKPEAKARMEELVANLKKAFANRIKNLDWMGDATKQKALAKLAAFRSKIGYQDKWRAYEGLEIKPDTYYENARNIGKWNYNYMITRLGKPVDRDRMGMTAPTVNASYNTTLNDITFPAGILQFPFFDARADDAVNYGGIGAVIGHEMSHGFDDNGSRYDADGTLRNWWTEEDRTKFDAKAATLAKQFDEYTVLDTIHVNGKLTLGENIGDLGGLNVAYEAFKMTPQGKSDKKIDGFTPDQRFFLSWAQVWMGNALPETTAQLIITDSHAPGPYRTIGAPVNMDAWYQAFEIKPGDKLYKKPEDRIRIW
jgi:putative endopeptidase